MGMKVLQQTWHATSWRILHPELMSNSPSNQDSVRENVEENAVDPRDLVNKGGYRKHPREIVENPAVTPEMHNENQDSRAGFVRDERDEAKETS